MASLCLKYAEYLKECKWPPENNSCKLISLGIRAEKLDTYLDQNTYEQVKYRGSKYSLLEVRIFFGVVSSSDLELLEASKDHSLVIKRKLALLKGLGNILVNRLIHFSLKLSFFVDFMHRIWEELD